MFFRRAPPKAPLQLQPASPSDLQKLSPPRATATHPESSEAETSGTPALSYQHVLDEKSLPPELDIRSLGDLVKSIPVRLSHSNECEFYVGDIRRRGIIRFQYDGSDMVRQEIVQRLSDPYVIEFFSSQFGERRYAADCQVHRMGQGSSLAEHRHGREDIFVVFHFDRDYQGGAYFEQEGDMRSHPEIPPYSACVSRFAVPHGVEEVLVGERIVLVTSWDYSSHKR